MLSKSQMGQHIPSGDLMTSTKKKLAKMRKENRRMKTHNSKNHWKPGKALLGRSAVGPPRLTKRLIRYDMNKCSD